MDIKVIGIINEKDQFETELKEYVNKGYKIIASNISTDNRKKYVSIGGKIREHNSEPDIYFYALLQKE